MQYVVQVVGDDELPEGVDRVTIFQAGHPPMLLINGAPARAWAFMQACQDMMEPVDLPTLLLPDMRPLIPV